MPVLAGTVDEVRATLRDKLRHLVPPMELDYKAELIAEILRLKQERHALILGHNYMEPALFHSVPDYTGDSLELCRRAAQTDRDPIVFCGVRFMAETAKILNPERTVLLPSLNAGCSLAGSITAEDVRAMRRRFPGAPVVSYINTYAEVKAESDVCCTSSNAARVIDSLDSATVIFVPDEYLARNVAQELDRQVVFPSQDGHWYRSQPGGGAPGIVGWHGRCEVHERFTPEDVKRVRRQIPDVIILAHPECAPEVVALADFSGSTTAMMRYVRTSSARRYLLLTECSMGDNIEAENRDKEMVRLCSVRCPHMNEITLEETRAALRENRYVIDVPPAIAGRARRAVERMLEIA